MIDISDPIDFFVTSYSPFQHPPEGHSDIDISGTDLDKVKRAEIKSPSGDEIRLEILNQNEYHMKIRIPEEIPKNSCFFVLLHGDSDSWFPVGPMMKLDSQSTVQ